MLNYTEAAPFSRSGVRGVTDRNADAIPDYRDAHH
jgi:hypothetical protein